MQNTNEKAKLQPWTKIMRKYSVIPKKPSAHPLSPQVIVALTLNHIHWCMSKASPATLKMILSDFSENILSMVVSKFCKIINHEPTNMC